MGKNYSDLLSDREKIVHNLKLSCQSKKQYITNDLNQIFPFPLPVVTLSNVWIDFLTFLTFHSAALTLQYICTFFLIKLV